MADVMVTSPFRGLDLLSSSIILLDENRVVRYINPEAENLLLVSGKAVCGRYLEHIAGWPGTLSEAVDNVLSQGWKHSRQNIEIRRNDAVVLHLNCAVDPVEIPEARLLIELWPIDQQVKATREERLLELQLTHRELIRNLAHEIKNPLGGIRGAAQLLERELEGMRPRAPKTWADDLQRHFSLPD